jgi:hypothetical protein
MVSSRPRRAAPTVSRLDPAQQEMPLRPEEAIGYEVVNAKGYSVGGIEYLVADQSQERYAV